MMIKITPLVTAAFLLISTSAPCQEIEGDSNVDYDFIKKNCHFEFSDTLKRDVTSIDSFVNKHSEFNVQVVLYLKSKINGKTIKQELSIFCRKNGDDGKLQWPSIFEGNPKLIQNLLSKKRSPKSIINEQDSGGRYGRQVKWERKFAAKNWHGTIAYSDSAFGDQTIIPESGYFIACPDDKNFNCFSLEIDQAERLRKTDVNKITDLLREVRISM